ncbi:MAG: hypothetical protein JHC41_00630 [Nitrosopumilus sp.]|nr:hypothetical protein [Nitrosopumilus sp.]
MVNRTVATKLTEEEHSKLISECNRLGVTPFALIKESIMEKIEPKEIISEDVPTKVKLTAEDLKKIEDLMDFSIWKTWHKKKPQA